MVELQPSKLATWVRSPSPAQKFRAAIFFRYSVYGFCGAKFRNSNIEYRISGVGKITRPR